MSVKDQFSKVNIFIFHDRSNVYFQMISSNDKIFIQTYSYIVEIRRKNIFNKVKEGPNVPAWRI